MTDRRLAHGELDPETLRWLAREARAFGFDSEAVNRLTEMARLEERSIRARQKRRRAEAKRDLR